MSDRSTSFAMRVTVVAVALTVSLGVGVFADRAPLTRQASAVASAPTPTLTSEQQEAFLKKARIVRTRSAGKGVTGSLRATLSDGVLTHDAHVQTVDQSMREFRSNRGTELNFVDSWRYNVAAYRIDRLLGINMTPPSVERNHDGKPAAFTWWVDDFLMDEGQRLKEKATAPDSMAWNQQMWQVRLFDQLIANVDRILGNLVIDKAWTVWMIDHTRAFRLADKVKTAANLTRIERQVLERLKALDQPALKAATNNYLTGPEIRSLLARRDDIVAHFEKLGPGAVFDRSQRSAQ